MNEIDTHIITRCRSGQKEAFRVIVQTYQRMVFSLSLKMLADEDDAKDILQETFIRVWQNISSYSENYKFSTWIYTIATRLCLDRLKRSSRTQPLPEDEDAFRAYADNLDAQRQMENHQWVSIIRVLASRLSEKQRLVFTLVHFENLSPDEVQQITGLDAAKIKSNLYVARQTIRQQLIKLGYDKD